MLTYRASIPAKAAVTPGMFLLANCFAGEGIDNVSPIVEIVPPVIRLPTCTEFFYDKIMMDGYSSFWMGPWSERYFLFHDLLKPEE